MRSSVPLTITTATLVVAVTTVVDAATAPQRLCNPAIINQDTCTIRIEREDATSPLPIKIRPNKQVWIVTEKRPFEDIKSVVSNTQQPIPDVLAALINNLAKPLASLTFSASVDGAAAATVKSRRAGAPPLPTAVQKICAASHQEMASDLANIKYWQNRVDVIVGRQDAQDNLIGAQEQALTGINAQIRQLQEYVPSRTKDHRWADSGAGSNDGPQCIAAVAQRLQKRIRGNTQPDSSSCAGFKDIPALVPPPVGGVALVKDDVDALHRSYVSDIDAINQKFNALTSRQPAIAQCPDYVALQAQVQSLNVWAPTGVSALLTRQDQITKKLSDLQQAESTLIPLAEILASRSTLIGTAPNDVLQDEHAYGGSESGQGIRNTSAKLSAQQVLTKDSTDLATVSISWTDPRWEISGGVLISNLVSRSFQNSPIISNGVPARDSSGKVLTVVTDSISSPVVVPFVFVHYRLPFVSSCGSRRCGFFASAGVGSSSQSGSSADFAVGPTWAYGSFMVSVVLHLTRDVRLTNGVTVGQQLGSSPPNLPTEKYWVHKGGIAFTYNLPIP